MINIRWGPICAQVFSNYIHCLLKTRLGAPFTSFFIANNVIRPLVMRKHSLVLHEQDLSDRSHLPILVLDRLHPWHPSLLNSPQFRRADLPTSLAYSPTASKVSWKRKEAYCDYMVTAAWINGCCLVQIRSSLVLASIEPPFCLVLASYRKNKWPNQRRDSLDHDHVNRSFNHWEHVNFSRY